MRLGKNKVKGIKQEELEMERKQTFYRSSAVFSSAQQSYVSSMQSSNDLSDSEDNNNQNHFISRDKQNQLFL